jgi:2-polyprenyl-3-methyl-5-hydroxy-6-metoxy-1,4-benzoquinol methylase
MAESEEKLYDDDKFTRILDLVTRIKTLFESPFWHDEMEQKYKHMLADRHVMTSLEIGTSWWVNLLPAILKKEVEVTAINLSAREIERHQEMFSVESMRYNVDFVKMDANELNFKGKTFDFIFGGAIVHHLDHDKFLNGLQKTLADNGMAIFREPWDGNILFKLYRFLTPWAHTEDEAALNRNFFELLDERFKYTVSSEQLLTVFTQPFLSVFGLWHRNPLTYLTFKLDKFLLNNFPILSNFARIKNIFVEKRGRSL